MKQQCSEPTLRLSKQRSVKEQRVTSGMKWKGVDSSLESLADPFKARCIRLVERIATEGLPFVVFETRRGAKRAQKLWLQGRKVDEVTGLVTVVGPVVTQARPGEGPHAWGCAADFVLDTDPQHPWWAGDDSTELPKSPWDASTPLMKLTWERLGRAAEACDLEWGGRWKFKDLPHVQLRDWKKYRPANWKDVILRELSV
jgi:hypothetical protein